MILSHVRSGKLLPLEAQHLLVEDQQKKMNHFDHRPYSASQDDYAHGLLIHTPIAPHPTSTWTPPYWQDKVCSSVLLGSSENLALG